MIKRILSVLFIVLFLGLVPLVGGCEDEIKSETHTEIKDKQVGPPVEKIE